MSDLHHALGYLRTSSATNVGDDKDSDKRQKAAIERGAAREGFTIVDWFYDADVKGDIEIADRPGFSDMLDRIEGNGVRVVFVEGADRFQRAWYRVAGVAWCQADDSDGGRPDEH
jgi:DNA invertase Pin-like site-specific DNA recombinase